MNMKFMLCLLFLCVFDKFITSVKCAETENSSSRERAEVSEEVSGEVTHEVTDTVNAEGTEGDERDSNEIKRATSSENDDSEVAAEDVTSSIEESKKSEQDLSNYDNNSKGDRINDNHGSIEQHDTSNDRTSSDSNEKQKNINKDHSDENSQSHSDEMNPGIKPVWLGEANPQYLSEQLNGHQADAFGTNQHYSYPSIYKDLSRRFVLQYPYEEISKNKESQITEDKLKTIKESVILTEDKLIPVKAPPDLVLAVAKESALLESAKPKNPTDELLKKEALRTGEYWDGIWKEDMDSKLLRSKQKVLKSKKNKFIAGPIKKTGVKPKLGSIRAKVMPGSNLYGLISVLKEYSPRLLYVVNKNKI